MNACGPRGSGLARRAQSEGSGAGELGERKESGVCAAFAGDANLGAVVAMGSTESNGEGFVLLT